MRHEGQPMVWFQASADVQALPLQRFGGRHPRRRRNHSKDIPPGARSARLAAPTNAAPVGLVGAAAVEDRLYKSSIRATSTNRLRTPEVSAYAAWTWQTNSFNSLSLSPSSMSSPSPRQTSSAGHSNSPTCSRIQVLHMSGPVSPESAEAMPGLSPATAMSSIACDTSARAPLAWGICGAPRRAASSPDGAPSSFNGVNFCLLRTTAGARRPLGALDGRGQDDGFATGHVATAISLIGVGWTCGSMSA
mmetsp:Transcript_82433/g.238085  ORF Transcript_82433/g.238085 Transcript_82433/m.238085 type:complete len:248 (+) Transcript_82433:840-1583(+)